MKAENNGLFKQHLFRNMLSVGMIFGGIAGWLLSRGTAVRVFHTVMGIGGVLYSPASFFMKHPPKQVPDDEAFRNTEEFITGDRHA